MNRLYDFTEEYMQAFDAIQIDEESGEVLGLEELETLNAQLEDKLEAVAQFLLEHETMDAAQFRLVYEDPAALSATEEPQQC